MDISTGSVSAGQNFTHQMDPGINTSIQTKYIKSKYVCITIRNIQFLYNFL